MTKPKIKHQTVKHHPKRSRHVYEGRFIDRAIYVAAFAEPLATVPQVYAIFKLQSAVGVSLSTWTMYLIFAVMWLWYGIVHQQRALIVAETLFIATEVLVIAGGIAYGAHW